MSLSARIVLAGIAPALFVGLLVTKLCGADFSWIFLATPIPVEIILFVAYCRHVGFPVKEAFGNIARRIGL